VRVDLRSHHGSTNPFNQQVVNYSHLFPTRYALELEGLKGSVSNDTFKEPSQREDAKKNIKKLLEERYTTGKNKWFFQPLRVRPRPLLPPTTSLMAPSVLSLFFFTSSHSKCMHYDHAMTFSYTCGLQASLPWHCVDHRSILRPFAGIRIDGVNSSTARVFRTVSYSHFYERVPASLTNIMTPHVLCPVSFPEMTVKTLAI
jgi:hypothetical protein